MFTKKHDTHFFQFARTQDGEEKSQNFSYWTTAAIIKHVKYTHISI